MKIEHYLYKSALNIVRTLSFERLQFKEQLSGVLFGNE